jgi:hypothetical protein
MLTGGVLDRLTTSEKSPVFQLKSMSGIKLRRSLP